MKIGVYGSASGSIEKHALDVAKRLGILIAVRGHTLITGACGGVPYATVKGAMAENGTVIGYSPARSMEEHQVWVMPTQGFSKIVFVPESYEHAGKGLLCRKGRNISSVAACDAAVFISGQYGTLNEFTLAYDFQKPIGVLVGTGGIADLLSEITRKIDKHPKPPLFFFKDPVEIIDALEQCVTVQP